MSSAFSSVTLNGRTYLFFCPELGSSLFRWVGVIKLKTIIIIM